MPGTCKQCSLILGYIATASSYTYFDEIFFLLWNVLEYLQVSSVAMVNIKLISYRQGRIHSNKKCLNQFS